MSDTIGNRVIKVYGASDDLIEVEGVIEEEFTAASGAEGDYLAFSDGTLAHIVYSDAGIWRIRILVPGASTGRVETCDESAGTGYSDILTLVGDVRWVAQAIGYNVARTRVAT